MRENNAGHFPYLSAGYEIKGMSSVSVQVGEVGDDAGHPDVDNDADQAADQRQVFQ